LAKKKSVKKTGVKRLHLPTLLSYLVAGVGAIFIVIFLVYVVAKSGPSPKELSPEEKQRWEQAISDFKKDGALISFEQNKEKKDEGLAVVDENLWNKFPYGTKETLCLAIAKEIDIRTLLVKNREGTNLATYRAGGRIYENKNL